MLNFFRQLFSESGQVSFSRTGSFVALLAACAWVSKIVWATHALPNLEGLVLFVSTLYGLGKAGETVQRLASRPPTTGQRTEG
jgi:hypothetical protein